MTRLRKDTASPDRFPARAETLIARLDHLGTLSSNPKALTRLYLTEAHKQAATAVLGWMRDAGMSAAIDAVGNAVGRYPASRPDARTLILGSHIDTVRDAGRYDGCFGVVAAIEAVAALRDAGERLPFAIEVIAFGDEEGVRFPEALASSRAIAGRFDPAVLDVVDDDGISFRDALVAFGCDPSAIGGLAHARRDVLGYVEVHIEQGPVLEAEDLPVGVVTAIAGATRFKAKVKGVPGHAGTVPMRLRRDALAAVAEMMVALERRARETPDLVATVGRIEALPGAVNVIPAQASFTVDLRSPSDATRRAAAGALEQEFTAIARRRDVGFSVEPFYAEDAAPCAPAFRQGFAEAIRRCGVRPLELPSGAGHDGLAMIALCPIGMLFVRCAGGVSHNPDEAITTADAGVALDVLVDLLRHLDPDSLARPA